MERTEIPHSDVFVSWTGADRDIKNKIVTFLRGQGISCTESDHTCSGDFHQWSREAVSRSTIFLLLYTENTSNSKLVPVEIDAFRKLEDRHNRCVPIVTDFALYKENLPDIGDRESAVILENKNLTDDHLDQILWKVRSLICHRLFSIYRSATAPAYLRFESLLRELRMTTEFQHEKLYINRSVADEAGKVISNAAVFCKSRDIIYLSGPAGSGKTCYIDQLRNAAREDTLVLSLPCRKLLNQNSLFEELYKEFCRYCGNSQFYSEANFKSLLSVKHLLLVLDGLDEIGTKEGKKTLFEATQEYYKANAGSTTLFITCRNSEDADMWKMNGQTPRVMKLQPLDENQIKAFGSRLLRLLDVPDRSKAFYDSVCRLAQEIRTNPLLLSHLAVIYKEKNELPGTIVGIYDAVWEIMMEKIKSGKDVAVDFDSEIFQNLPDILKSFSAEHYHLLSQGKVKTTEQIFKKTLRDHACNPNDAPVLIRYLQDRGIMEGNEFYHKMLLEYFTAVHYYEQCFDDYDELENLDVIASLFSHYGDSYWSAVVQMFLLRADSRTDAHNANALYHAIMTRSITDFTLLFDTCRDLPCHKETARTALLKDILERSATGVYPPYGPLFWYVPEYDLYFDLLGALASLQETPCFSKALALTRDVCWIFGKYHTAEAANNRINSKALLEKANLSGIRKGLCELFYQGRTDFAGGRDIYPRCFNLAEAESVMTQSCGIYGRMDTPFQDELGLYSLEMLCEFGGEWVGIVSAEYDVTRIEKLLPTRSCRKLCGLFLSSPKKAAEMRKLAINDTHLRVVYLPENIQLGSISLFGRPFAYEGVFVDGNGLMYFRDALIFPDSMTEIKDCVFSSRFLASVTIPNSVTEIGNDVFYDCNALTSVTIPESVKKIGDRAFSGCSSLASVTISEGVKEIGRWAFYECSSLTSVTIPESVTVIGEGVFRDCNSLASVTIPESVTEIGAGVFKDCNSLASVAIPDSVTEIRREVFSGCSSLTSVTIPNSATKIGYRAFSGCSSLTSVTIPDRVTDIEDWAFSDCSVLTSITLPNDVAWIGTGAFSSCHSLTSVSIPESVTKIGDRIFSDCSSLISITIPDNVVKIEYRVFAGCSSLVSITIPDSVKKIEDWAFSGCSALPYVRLPENLREIGQYAFHSCTALKRISNYPTFCNQELFGISDECIIEYRKTTPQEISFRSNTAILWKEFSNRKDIACISIPAGITRIEGNAFINCSSLASVLIPNGVTQIGGAAFLGCSSLASITVPDSVTRIGGRAFSDCSALTSFTIPDSVALIEREVFSGCSSLASVTIPNSVTQIGDRAFSGCRALISVTIPEGVEKIGYSAFSNCSALTSVTIPEGVREIGIAAFCSCSSLASITVPNSVTRIGYSAFEGCGFLASFTIPNRITEIRESVFRDCSSLASVTIPNSVTEIGEWAFSGCSALASVTIPEGVEEIGDSAFSGCSSLISVSIPESITKIGNGTFSDCSSLASVTIPNSVTDIEDWAFSDCSALTSITLPNDVAWIGKGAFSGCGSLVSIFIPEAVRHIGDKAFGGCIGLREITLSRRFEDDLPRLFKNVDLSEVKITWH